MAAQCIAGGFLSIAGAAGAGRGERFDSRRFHGVMAWDLFYNVLGGAGGGVIQVVRNLQNPRKYSNRIAVELGLSMFVSAFAGLLTYLLVASSDAVSVNGLFMLFLSCCAGVLGYEAIKLYTDDFKKTVKGKTDV
jgi:hypothetical protein